MNDDLKLAIEHWPFVSSLLTKPQNERDYDGLVKALDDLLDIVGESEAHPLKGLLDIMADWIEGYDHEHRPMPVASGVDVLRIDDARAWPETRRSFGHWHPGRRR